MYKASETSTGAHNYSKTMKKEKFIFRFDE